MIGVHHIHRPSLERYALSKFNTLGGVDITEDGTPNKFVVRHGTTRFSVNTHDHSDIFDHKVHIDALGQAWFHRAGCGKDSRRYAENHDHQCLVSAETATQTGSCRKFTSFADNQSFLTYAADTHEQHMYESIRPNVPCMFFTDHDMKGGLDSMRTHSEGVLDVLLLVTNYMAP